MISCDFHLHTNFSDGKHSPTEVAAHAYANGMTILGFSEHSHLSFEDCCLKPEKQEQFIREVTQLKEYYRDRMTILCGMEKDYYSTVPEEFFDFVIGSVHYLYVDGDYCAVDDNPDVTAKTIATHFGGDPYAYVEAYFANVRSLFDHVRADFIGHFDLVTKFHEKNPMWDTDHPRYKRAWHEAVDALIPYGKPFEINSGAISRGWRTTPYPAPDMLRYIHDKGGHILLTSDSHAKETLCHRFEASRELAISCGFTSQLIPSGNGTLIEITL